MKNTNKKLTIGIIIGSTRPKRNGKAVGEWVYNMARERDKATYALIDLKEVDLPFLDEPKSPMQGDYKHTHTRSWSERIAPFDAFILVTPEYNHGTSAALKNALDFLYKEWNRKPVGFVSYGSDSGIRAVEQLRQVVVELRMAPIRTQVSMSLYDDFKDFTEFEPRDVFVKKLPTLFDELEEWAAALVPLREKEAVAS
jgi:NAD(P)H-dependent FMN reductase